MRPSVQATKKRYSDYLASPIISVKVGYPTRTQVYRLHSALLSANSHFFKAALNKGSTELTSKTIELEVLPELFAYFVEYNYSVAQENSSLALIDVHGLGVDYNLAILSHICAMAVHLGAESFRAHALRSFAQCLDITNNDTHQSRQSVVAITVSLKAVAKAFTEDELDNPACDLLFWYTATRLKELREWTKFWDFIDAHPKIAVGVLKHPGDSTSRRPGVVGMEEATEQEPTASIPNSTEEPARKRAKKSD